MIFFHRKFGTWNVEMKLMEEPKLKSTQPRITESFVFNIWDKFD